MSDSYWRFCVKVFEHFAIALDTAVGWAFTNCRIQSRLLRCGCTERSCYESYSVCLSVGLYALKKPELLITTIQHLIQRTAKSILNNLILTSLLHVSLTNSWLFVIHRAVSWIRYCIISLLKRFSYKVILGNEWKNYLSVFIQNAQFSWKLHAKTTIGFRTHKRSRTCSVRMRDSNGAGLWLCCWDMGKPEISRSRDL